MKWFGRCPGCNSWNSLVEEYKVDNKKSWLGQQKSTGLPQKLTEISFSEEERIDTGIPEFNRFWRWLGSRSIDYVGGDPGIGKSTLTLQTANLVKTSGTVLYVTGEESPQQIKMRAQRLEVANSNLLILAETNLENN